MKKLVFVIAIILLIGKVYSQKVIGKISTKNALSDFHAISFHDSVLISYKETPLSQIDGFKRNMWLKANGSFRNDYFAADILCITQVEDAVYYYFFADNTKNLKLKALVEKPNRESRSGFPSEIPVEGKIIGTYYDKNLFLISFNEVSNQVIVLEIKGMEVLNEKKYLLPIPFSKFLKKDLQLFNGQSMLNSFMGWAKVKLYRYKDLYITVDEPFSSDSPKRTVQTHVFILKSESEAVESLSFPEAGKDKFSSFVVDNKLFRTTTSKKRFSLDVYDLQSQTLISKKEILKDQESFSTYFRYGKENLISHEMEISKMIGAMGMAIPSLVVFSDSLKYHIQWGTYYDEKGIMAVSPTNILALVVMAVGTTIKQLGDGPGVSRYFYNEWDSSTGEFVLNKEPGNVRNKIDQYEIGMATKAKYTSKNYIQYGASLLAIYYEGKKNEVTLVQFD